MKPEHLSLLTGFIGTLLGAGVSLFTVWIQQRSQERREKARFSIDAAFKDFESVEKYAMFMNDKGVQVKTKSLIYYISLHSELFKNISKGNEITKENCIAAYKKSLEIESAAEKFFESLKNTPQP